jgi:drug/metabolite transporter superfamily protein YnfA
MTAAPFAESAALTLAVLLALSGAAVAWSAPNLAKRLTALMVALIAVALALGALRTPPGVLIAVAAIGFAYAAVGAALIVRAQENYASVEASEIDVADAADEKGPAA